MWDIEQTGITVTVRCSCNGLEVAGRSIYVGMPVGGGTFGLSHLVR